MSDLLVIYRPELENPPRASSIAIAPDYSADPIVINPGTNRGFSRDSWEQIKAVPLIEGLLTIGALEAVEVGETVPEAGDRPTEIGGLPVEKALEVIDLCWDIEALSDWREADKRIKVRNRINDRITAITEGKG